MISLNLTRGCYEDVYLWDSPRIIHLSHYRLSTFPHKPSCILHSPDRRVGSAHHLLLDGFCLTPRQSVFGMTVYDAVTSLLATLRISRRSTSVV